MLADRNSVLFIMDFTPYKFYGAGWIPTLYYWLPQHYIINHPWQPICKLVDAKLVLVKSSHVTYMYGCVSQYQLQYQRIVCKTLHSLFLSRLASTIMIWCRGFLVLGSGIFTKIWWLSIEKIYLNNYFHNKDRFISGIHVSSCGIFHSYYYFQR